MSSNRNRLKLTSVANVATAARVAETIGVKAEAHRRYWGLLSDWW
jgi:hypothetical protein